MHVRGNGLEFTAIDYNNDSTLTNPDLTLPNYDTSAGGYDGDSLKSPVSDRAFYYLCNAWGQVMGLSAGSDDEQILEYRRYRAFGEAIHLDIVDDGSGSGTASDLIEDTGSDLGDNNTAMTSTRTTYGSHVRATSGVGSKLQVTSDAEEVPKPKEETPRNRKKIIDKKNSSIVQGETTFSGRGKFIPEKVSEDDRNGIDDLQCGAGFLDWEASERDHGTLKYSVTVYHQMLVENPKRPVGGSAGSPEDIGAHSTSSVEGIIESAITAGGSPAGENNMFASDPATDRVNGMLNYGPRCKAPCEDPDNPVCQAAHRWNLSVSKLDNKPYVRCEVKTVVVDSGTGQAEISYTCTWGALYTLRVRTCCGCKKEKGKALGFEKLAGCDERAKRK